MSDDWKDRQRLEHMVAAIEEIENYIDNATEQEFLENSMMRFATIKQLEIIGEASVYLSENVKELHEEVAWKEIKGLRNILIHEYFGVDNYIIWQIAKTDIPQFKEQIVNILQKIK